MAMKYPVRMTVKPCGMDLGSDAVENALCRNAEATMSSRWERHKGV
jgi:hypothetical protein